MLFGMTEQRDVEKNSGPDSAEAKSEPVGQAQQGQPAAAERRGPPPNPLYHPLFLPVLLVAFSLWFGYDGFLTTDPEMLEHQTFNRIMFAIMLPLCLWMVPRGIREFREDQAQAAKEHSEGKSS